jgi:hypothetical protein
VPAVQRSKKGAQAEADALCCLTESCMAAYLCLSATERKRLHSIARTCELGAWWFWPRTRH